MVTANEKLAQAVKERMSDKGWKAPELAQRAGITEAALYRSLAGLNDWPLTRIFKVAAAFDIEGWELLAEAQNSPSLKSAA